MTLPDSLKRLSPKVLQALTSPGVLEALTAPASAKKFAAMYKGRTQSEDGKVLDFYSFTPRPKLHYQNYIFRSKARLMALVGGNQIGKTLSGKRFVVAHLLGSDPVMNPGVQYRTPSKVWAFTKGHLVEGLFEEILEMIPPQEIVPNGIRRTLGKQRIKLNNGSLLEMKSHDLDREAVQQAKCDIVWWDEEGPKDHWLELWVRLAARGGVFLLTLTPVRGTIWLHDKLYKLEEKYRNALSGKFAWFSAAMTDNDTLDQDVVKTIIQECADDPDQLDIRVKGIYRVLSGSALYPQESLEYQHEVYKRAELKRINFDSSGNFFLDPDSRNHWKIWEDPVPGCGYAIGADIAEGGEKSDYSSAHTVKVSNNQVVATWHGHEQPDVFGWECLFAGRLYNNSIIAPEVNKQGGAFLAVLKEAAYPAIYQRTVLSGKMAHFLGTYGWSTDKFSKPKAALELRQLLLKRQIAIPDGGTLEELANFQRERKERPRSFGYSAVTGHDDRVMSLIIAIQATKQGIIGSHPQRGLVYGEAGQDPAERWRAELEESYENPKPSKRYAHL